MWTSVCVCVGIEQGTLLSCVNDVAAAAQHTVACHLAKRTHRAILFCKAKGLLPPSSPTLVSESLHFTPSHHDAGIDSVLLVQTPKIDSLCLVLGAGGELREFG